jgi:hypothetical protein
LFKPEFQHPPLPSRLVNTRTIVVLGQHRFYHHLSIELAEAAITREGKLKNPVKTLDPMELIWKSDKTEEIKFYTGLSRFQHPTGTRQPESDIEGLKALIRNPLGLPFYANDPKVSENLTAPSLVPVQVSNLRTDLRLLVHGQSDFYAVSAQLVVEDQAHDLKKLSVRFRYFVRLDNRLFLIDNADLLRIIDFFRQHNSLLLVHASRFEEFKQNFLSRLEHQVRIHYSYLKTATPVQLEESGFARPPEKMIYLSDTEGYVVITPVVRYGKVEVPVLSKKQIHAVDPLGNPFVVERDDALELAFTASLLKQHPDFREQLHQTGFYLPRGHFLEEGWFLEAFEAWQSLGITVLGFNDLKENRLNLHRAKVSVNVSSGADWFDTTVEIQYGKQRVSLKHLHQAVRNKNRFVQLGDGTLGILPTEWIERFLAYFQVGEVGGKASGRGKSTFRDWMTSTRKECSAAK